MSSRLDAAYAAQVKAIRARVDAFAVARWGAGEFRDADAERFVAAVVPVVLAGRRQVSSLTDAYLSSVLTRVLGRKIAAQGPIDTDKLRDVPATDVYVRPFVTVRSKIADGMLLDAAAAVGLARLRSLVATDMQLAKTHTAQRSMSEHGVGGYRRVLSGGRSCDLCAAASENTYRRGDLMPIHPGCDCGVEPIAGDVTGPTLSADVVVRHHGELGPLLAVPGQHFDGPSVAN